MDPDVELPSLSFFSSPELSSLVVVELVVLGESCFSWVAGVVLEMGAVVAGVVVGARVVVEVGVVEAGVVSAGIEEGAVVEVEGVSDCGVDAGVFISVLEGSSL